MTTLRHQIDSIIRSLESGQLSRSEAGELLEKVCGPSTTSVSTIAKTLSQITKHIYVETLVYQLNDVKLEAIDPGDFIGDARRAILRTDLELFQNSDETYATRDDEGLDVHPIWTDSKHERLNLGAATTGRLMRSGLFGDSFQEVWVETRFSLGLEEQWDV